MQLQVQGGGCSSTKRPDVSSALTYGPLSFRHPSLPYGASLPHPLSGSPPSCSEVPLMLQPVSACSLCACCGLSLILEKPRVLGALVLTAHVLSSVSWGSPFVLSLLNILNKSPAKPAVASAEEEASLSWRKEPAPLNGANRILKHVTHK